MFSLEYYTSAGVVHLRLQGREPRQSDIDRKFRIFVGVSTVYSLLVLVCALIQRKIAIKLKN